MPTSQQQTGSKNDLISRAHELLEQAKQLRERKEVYEALQVGERAIDSFARAEDQAGQAQALYLALELYRALGDPLGEANTLKAIGDVQQFRDERDAALDSYQQALALFRQVGDRLGEANVLHAIGDIQRFCDEYDTALASYRCALELYRAVGARLGEANALQSIGDIQRFRGEYDAALVSYNHALELYRVIGDRLGEANIMMSVADIRAARGDLKTALENYRAALSLKEAVGDLLGTANAFVGMAQALAGTEPEVALEYYQRALSIYEGIGDQYSITRAFYNLGLLYYDQGEFENALDALTRSEAGFVTLGLTQQARIVGVVRAEVDYELGKQYADQGRWYDALHLLEESLAIRRQGDDLSARADTIYHIARTHHLIGNLEKARVHYRDALRLYEHLGNQRGVAACKTGLGRLAIQMGFLDDALREVEQARQIYADLDDVQRVSEVEEILRLADHIKEKQPI